MSNRNYQPTPGSELSQAGLGMCTLHLEEINNGFLFRIPWRLLVEARKDFLAYLTLYSFCAGFLIRAFQLQQITALNVLGSAGIRKVNW